MFEIISVVVVAVGLLVVAIALALVLVTIMLVRLSTWQNDSPVFLLACGFPYHYHNVIFNAWWFSYFNNWTLFVLESYANLLHFFRSLLVYWTWTVSVISSSKVFWLPEEFGIFCLWIFSVYKMTLYAYACRGNSYAVVCFKLLVTLWLIVAGIETKLCACYLLYWTQISSQFVALDHTNGK